jgi:hypothetical protein
MPSLQVREEPVDLYETLQKEAKCEHRSLAQQAIVTLSRGMNTAAIDPERRRNLLKIIREFQICPPDLKLSDAAAVVCEDRKR